MWRQLASTEVANRTGRTAAGTEFASLRRCIEHSRAAIELE